MSIQNELDIINNIWSPEYARDVRRAIIDAVEKTYDEASKNGNANMEVSRARGHFPTLNDRLQEVDDKQDETTSQLAQKVGKGEPDSLSWAMANQNFKENVSGGQVAVVGRNSVGETNVINKSQPPVKTTYAIGGGGVNLWDGTFHNVIMNGNEPHGVLGGQNHVSAIIPVDPNMTITISKTLDSEQFRVGAFTTYPSEGAIPTHYFTNDATGSGVYTYTTKPNETYLLVLLSSNGAQPSEFQVEIGASPTDFISPNEKIVISLDEKSMAAIMERSKKNLFDGIWSIGHLAGNEPYELVVGSGKYTTSEIKPNTTYTISRSNDTNQLRLGLFTNYPQEGSIPNDYQSPGTLTWTFTSGSNDNYLVVVPTSLSEGKEPEWLQIEESSTVTDYESPYVIKEKLVPNKYKTNESSRLLNFVINGNFNAEYYPYSDAPVMDSSLDLDAVYDWFDEDVANYPDYVSRELLTNETTGLPVYLYRYTPPKIKNYTESTPQILHVNGIHGSEKQSLGSGMRFYRDLCMHWKENEGLELLKFNIEFLVVPAFNAYGVANNTRDNANGVNLNRNFLNGWRQTDPGYDSSGPAPLSEPESQAIDELLDTEKNIIFAIDHHRYNPFAQGDYTMWTGSKNTKMNTLLAGWSRKMNADFIKKHPDLTSEQGEYVSVQESYTNSSWGWLGMHFIDKGIPGTIFEISWDSSLSDYHTHALGDIFLFATKHFHNDKSKIFS